MPGISKEFRRHTQQLYSHQQLFIITITIQYYHFQYILVHRTFDYFALFYCFTMCCVFGNVVFSHCVLARTGILHSSATSFCTELSFPTWIPFASTLNKNMHYNQVKCTPSKKKPTPECRENRHFLHGLTTGYTLKACVKRTRKNG